MLTLLDTSVAIRLRDGDRNIENRLAARAGRALLSSVTRVELEGGVYRAGADTPLLRARLDYLLDRYEELPFGAAEGRAYGCIVAANGFARSLILDRMIAATALVADAILITANPQDFADIADLRTESW